MIYSIARSSVRGCAAGEGVPLQPPSPQRRDVPRKAGAIIVASLRLFEPGLPDPSADGVGERSVLVSRAGRGRSRFRV